MWGGLGLVEVQGAGQGRGWARGRGSIKLIIILDVGRWLDSLEALGEGGGGGSLQVMLSWFPIPGKERRRSLFNPAVERGRRGQGSLQ